MDNTETHTYTNETEAHEIRRQYIARGYATSLVALNPETDKYTFDVYY